VRPHRLRALLLGLSCSLCAATLRSGPARASETAAATPSPDAVDKAQSLFKKGAALFESKRYALALAQFRASHDAVASPNSRLYVARCLAELGEKVQAYLEFEEVSEEAALRAANEPRYAKTQQTAQLERDELARKIALLSVAVSRPETAASLEIAGKEVPRARWGKPFPVLPGQTSIVLRSKVAGPSTRDIQLAAGETRSIVIDASSSAPPTGGVDQAMAATSSAQDDAAGPKRSREHLRPYAYAAGGVGIAGFALFTVAGLMTNSTYSDLSRSCDGPCPPDRQGDVDSGKRQQTLANIGIAVGAVGLAAGTTLLILSFTGGSSDPQSAARATRLTIGPGFTGVRGIF
jgi:hypothetical protein